MDLVKEFPRNINITGGKQKNIQDYKMIFKNKFNNLDFINSKIFSLKNILLRKPQIKPQSRQKYFQNTSDKILNIHNIQRTLKT